MPTAGSVDWLGIFRAPIIGFVLVAADLVPVLEPFAH